MNKKEVLEKLKILEDPFENFIPVPNTVLEGWNGDSPFIPAMVNEVKPNLVLEVGSWMGQSSINFAKSLKALGLDSSVVCIDTWLGSTEHWIDLNLREKMDLRNGRPSFYNKFLTNIRNYKVEDMVTPLSLPSLAAASVLKHYEFKADLIYIDGSHDTQDVYNDLKAYWDLLNPNGIMFGDDFTWSSVVDGVQAFCSETGTPCLQQGINWVLRKQL